MRAGADAVYPGYGFLSENPALAEACANAGITFIGPTAEVLTLTGNKARAIAAAKAAGVPTLRSVEPGTDVDALVGGGRRSMPYPLFVKAVAGGGGRGMRRVDDRAELREAIETCMREAEGAFGDPTVFIEQAVVEPRHIEVQILADGEGNVMHLFERDCSVQRRHQKVVEIAPAPNLDPELRDRMCADAVRFATEIGYRNAGTVEFLLDPEGNYVFIEMNPRIQVEHTVTEEITDVDLVQSQMRIASGETLADLGLSQETVSSAARPCSAGSPPRTPPTASGPTPARSRPTAPPAAPASASTAARPTPAPRSRAHFDSMLAKLTCRGRTFEKAVEKARRAVAEFRIRGVSTNIAFLQAVLDDPDFAAGRVTTSFIETHPQLLAARASGDRGTKLLTYLADVTVNQPHGPAPVSVDPATKLPAVDLDVPAPDGTRQLLLELGPEEFARRLRAQSTVARHRHDLPRRPPVAARDPGAHPRPARGRRSRRPHDAAAVVARGLGRCDVRRGAALPRRGPVGAAGRAAPGGAQHLPADAAARAQHGRLHAVPDRGHRRLRPGGGDDRHRRLPDLRRAQRRRADATGDRGGARHRHHGRRGRALLHRRPVRPRRDALHARLLPRAGRADRRRRRPRARHQGHGRAAARPAARTLVTALRERFDLPVHLHTHDTPGGQLATLLAAIDAGVDAVDAACASMAGTTSQPPLSALVAATDHSERETGLSLAAVNALEPYWEATRRVYAPFESGLPAPTGRVYRHEIPGGQLSNLRQQAIALGLGEKFEQIEDMYAAANDILGNVVKVTPVLQGRRRPGAAPGGGRRRPASFADDPGLLRHPRLGDRLPQRRARRPAGRLARAVPHQGAGGSHLEAAGRGADRRAVRRPGRRPARARSTSCCSPARPRTSASRARRTATCRCCRPSTTSTACAQGEEHEVDLDEGKTLLLGLQAISEPDERGFRTVMCTINGQLRPVGVRDRSVASDVAAAEKADTGNARARRRAVRRRRHGRGRRGRRGRGRSDRSPPSRR